MIPMMNEVKKQLRESLFNPWLTRFQPFYPLLFAFSCHLPMVRLFSPLAMYILCIILLFRSDSKFLPPSTIISHNHPHPLLLHPTQTPTPTITPRNLQPVTHLRPARKAIYRRRAPARKRLRADQAARARSVQRVHVDLRAAGDGRSRGHLQHHGARAGCVGGHGEADLGGGAGGGEGHGVGDGEVGGGGAEEGVLG
jgi:hypothetical protein